MRTKIIAALLFVVFAILYLSLTAQGVDEPKAILGLILLIVFLLIVRLVVYRRAPKADYLEPTLWLKE